MASIGLLAIGVAISAFALWMDHTYRKNKPRGDRHASHSK